MPEFQEVFKLDKTKIADLIKDVRAFRERNDILVWTVRTTEASIPPTLLTVLESRGFVRDMKWTDKGIAWLNGDIDKA